MQNTGNPVSTLVMAYISLRRAIGILGVLLPLILSLGAVALFKTGLQHSISSYYYTGMRDVFVGTLCAIGVFLLSYKGYERKDDWAGNVACLFAGCVALLPTTPAGMTTALEKTIGTLHLVFAALFFLVLAYFSLHLFTKTDETKTPTSRKRWRNRVYRVCGYTILAAIALMVLLAIQNPQLKADLQGYNPIYWLESIAIVAFGVSWLTKGEAILGDKA